MYARDEAEAGPRLGGQGAGKLLAGNDCTRTLDTLAEALSELDRGSARLINGVGQLN